jgi:hypothetical protein
VSHRAVGLWPGAAEGPAEQGGSADLRGGHLAGGSCFMSVEKPSTGCVYSAVFLLSLVLDLSQAVPSFSAGSVALSSSPS